MEHNTHLELTWCK